MRKMLNGLLNVLWYSINISSFILMNIMIILVFSNAVLRYAFGRSFTFTADVLGFMFVWTIMLGATLAMRSDDHLNVRIIESLLPDTMIITLRRIVNIIVSICCLLLVMGCYRAMLQNITNTSPLSGIPIGVKYMAGFFACLIMGTITAIRVIKPLPLHEGENND